MTDDREEYRPSDHTIDLKGRAYLPVAERIHWFRREYPQGTIETAVVSIDEERGSAIYRARVATGEGGIAEASGSETARDFGDYIEKAETKAVGRALGYLGYGTAAAVADDDRNVVDAPIATRRPTARRTPPVPVPHPLPPQQAAPDNSGAAPTPDEGEERLPGMEPDWTEVWSLAKAHGVRGRESLDRFVGTETTGMDAPRVYQLLQRRLSAPRETVIV